MVTDPELFNDAYAMFEGLVNGQGRSLDEAAERLRRYHPDEVVDAVVRRWRDLAAEVRAVPVPALVDGRDAGSAWYQGPKPSDRFWPALRSHLEAEGWTETALKDLDATSTKVVAHLAPPWAERIRTRGLVLGHIQSGKTSNYTAVIAKAADAGYKMAVVLAGTHTSLRRQTQLRLDRQLVGPSRHGWFRLTDEERDFGRPHNPPEAHLQADQRLLAVVKKNPRRLENLILWLQKAADDSLDRLPILVIDDEADVASLNVAPRDDERTRINDLILRLLSLPKVAYISYTATPFANLFVDPSVPDDLYPRDFIVDLPAPEGYFGPERLFGREPLDEDDPGSDGVDAIRYVPDDEAEAMTPPRSADEREGYAPGVGPALAEAVRWFLLASAARRIREGGPVHTTMLVHVSQYIDAHERVRATLARELADLRRRIVSGDRDLLRELREQWDRETAALPPTEFGNPRHTAEAVVEEVPGVLADMGDFADPVDSTLVVDNSQSPRRLEYDETDPRPVIVIGGNTLSRGLTLEGLVSSYFIRGAGTYDTLLQMGRWFGYRPGYEDLPRIWTTPELEQHFRSLAAVETEIRADIRHYAEEGLTPAEAGVRVRTHPKLAVTSALKMRKAVQVRVSYSGTRVQTILFRHRDASWLTDNLSAARDLLEVAASTGRLTRRPTAHVIRDVPVEAVKEFLERYHFHEGNIELRSDLLLEYIRRQNRRGELTEWNVAVVTRRDGSLGALDLGPLGQVNLINRSRLRSSPPGYANINTLMSKVDRVIDVEADGLGQLRDVDLARLRTESGRALLLLYPISKDSRPEGRQSSRRVPLDAVEHVIGVALAFPHSGSPEPIERYVTVDPTLLHGQPPDEEPAPHVPVDDTEGDFGGDR